YYETLDKKHTIQKFLFLGERIYYGYVPIGMLDVDLNRILTFNEVERARVGFGVHTNKKFSKRLRLGLFAGYGIEDERIKYGVDLNYILPDVFFGEYRGYFSHDLKESGSPFFMFDRYQYSTETLRRFRLKVLDMVTETGHGIYFHPLNNLDVGAEVNLSVHQPTYSYQYNSDKSSSFQFTELRQGLRYAIREKYYKIEDRKFSLGTSYPIFYLQLSQSLGGFAGKYPYQKIDLKIEENIKILRIGLSKIQFIAGVTSGSTPYMKLYNEKGSRKGTYFLIHNSFETMGYNEFLSDRYYSVFYTHSFGRIYYGHRNIQPSISMMHNAGVGWLSAPEKHTVMSFPFKTMEKGYYESGAMVENILVLGLGGLKTGFGIGFFYRYGPYSSLKGSENLVLKFALNFGI
ncbi:MAG TPA: hypothetical protein VF691_02620, partial [Cytophagaceae bacterium]